jgi:hypothetical protein
LDPNARPFERPSHSAQATVISLDPDVMIVTIREVSPDARESAFEQWHPVYRQARSRGDYIERNRELIGARDVTLIYFAGTLLPWSSEMYVVSCDPKVATKELTFVNDRTEIRFPGGMLILTHKDGDVTVERINEADDG